VGLVAAPASAEPEPTLGVPLTVTVGLALPLLPPASAVLSLEGPAAPASALGVLPTPAASSSAPVSAASVSSPPAAAAAPTPAASPAQQPIVKGALRARARDIGAVQRSRSSTALVVLLAAAAVFLVVAGRLDRRSSAFASAPLGRRQDLLTFR
jgi:hypothetical protein